MLVFSFVSIFYHVTQDLFSFFYNEETSWKVELNIFKGRVHDLMRNEDWRRENKTKVGSICRNRKNWKKTNKTDVLSLKHRWKIVKHSWRYVQSLDRSDELRWIDAFPIITLNCQDNQTFLKMLFQSVKLATICLSHIIRYVQYIFKICWLIIYTLRNNLMNLKFPILISMNNIWYI